MPDLCFYAPWIMKEPIPDPFRMMLEKAGKKRISYDEADCSMRNIRKQGKVSRLHGPTLQALLTLIQIRKEKDSGAAGIQRGRDTINYFCMEYPGNQGKYVMTYNSKNGRFSGILKTEEKNEKLPGIREGKNTGEQYLALLAYANLVPDNPLFNEEFQKNFYILEEQEKKLEPAFAELVVSLVRKITGISCENKKDIILYLIGNSLRNIEKTSHITIRVSKEDISRVAAKKSTLKAIAKDSAELEVVEDSSLEAMQCIIETDHSMIDCSLDAQLQNLEDHVKLLLY